MVKVAGAYTLFPTLILNVDCSELLPEVSKLRKSVDMRTGRPDCSDSFLVLNQNLELKKKFEDVVNESLKNLQYTVPLEMTTSWFTYTEPGKFIPEHTHTNSFWSGVFYLQDSSPLQFFKEDTGISIPSMVQNENLVFCGIVPIEAKEGHMLLFQSHVRHGSMRNETNSARYSMAMNFMPNAKVLNNDSSYYYGTAFFNEKDYQMKPPFGNLRPY